MSNLEYLWIIGGLCMVALAWFSAAKAQQNIREAKEHAEEDRRMLEEILELAKKKFGHADHG
jgi:hypothetical protein